MIEAIVPVFIAGATGFSVLISRLHNRVHALDRRVDQFELRVADALKPICCVLKTNSTKLSLNDQTYPSHSVRIC